MHVGFLDGNAGRLDARWMRRKAGAVARTGRLGARYALAGARSSDFVAGPAAFPRARMWGIAGVKQEGALEGRAAVTGDIGRNGLGERVQAIRIRPGVLRQFEHWLGHPAWFRAGTSLAAHPAPWPELIPLADELLVLEAILAAGAAPQLVRRLLLAPGMPLSGPGIAALSVVPDVDAGVRLLVSAGPGGTPYLKVRMDQGADAAVVQVATAIPGEGPAFGALVFAAVLLRFVEGLAFDLVGEVELAVPSALEPLESPTAGELRCALVTDAPGLGVRLPLHVLALPNPSADLRQFRLMQDLGRLELKRDEDPILQGVRAVLQRTLRSERRVPRRGEVAAQLGMSERSLSRALSLAGSGYVALAEQERRVLAAELMLMPGMSLQGVADALGFPDQSTFGRSFRAWHGESPGRFRARLGLT